MIVPLQIEADSNGAVTTLFPNAKNERHDFWRNTKADLVWSPRQIAEPRCHKGENWWQTYIKSKILIIQQGYIKALDKINVTVVGTKFPDFSLLTHDSYLDILEIKKPSTSLLKKDESRDNYYWDTEISKAIIQVENYIEAVSRQAAEISVQLRTKHNIDIQVVRPRGIIVAGNSKAFTEQKEKNDFRLLSHSLKNITILTYDELLTRLRNYIEVLEEFRKAPGEGAIDEGVL